MKFLFKIFSILSFFISGFMISQIPVHKPKESLKPRLKEKVPPTPKMTFRDSVQQEVYRVMIHSYDWDEDHTDPEDDLILVLRKKITESKGLRKTLYQYYLANMYASYISEYSARIRKKDITPLKNLPEDYKTWAVNDFYREANQLYGQSLSDRQNLQNEKTELWTDLVEDVEFTKYKPTLYDLVATSYLQFLERLPFDYDSTAIQKKKDLKNDLLQFHAHDTDKTALIYLKSTQIEGSAKKQSQELEALADAFPKEPFSAYLLFQAADLVKQEKSEHNFLNAHQLCQKAIDRIPQSDWSTHCQKMINELDTDLLTIEIPQRNLPGEYIPMKTIHKNMDELRLTLTKRSGKIDFDKKPVWDHYGVEEKLIVHTNNEFDELNFRTEIFSLKKSDEYKPYQTLLALQPLEEGLYHLKVSSKNEDDSKIFAVSDLFYLKRSENDTQVVFQAINSKTGESIKNTGYIMYQNINNYENKYDRKRDNKIIKTGSGTTNQYGLFALPKSQKREYDNSIIYFPQLKKYFVIDENYNEIKDNQGRNEISEEPLLKNFIVFTDRAIYRPGQKVFYKGILKQEYYEKTKVLPRQKVVVRLINAVSQDVSKAEATTNEFGSITGTFTLPTDGFTGDYSIIMESDLGEIPGKEEYHKASGFRSFKVEEYKRPKFRVIIDPVKEALKLGQNVKVTAKAEAFSGARISGAAVKYEVKRQRIYFWRNYYEEDQYSSNENDSETEIAHGETTTDNNGQFSISFNAEAAEQSKGNRRSYQYFITAYVTDINGESQSSQSVVTVGDLKAQITIESPVSMLQKDWKSLKINASNLNNQKIEATGNLTITQLIGEDKILLPKLRSFSVYRGYNRDDRTNIVPYQYYNKEVFDTYFPYISYSLKSSREKLEKGKIVYSKQFNTSETEDIILNKNPEPGKYLVEAESVINRDTIKTFKVIQILDNITFRDQTPVYFRAKMDKPSYRVGEKATVTFYSDFEEGFVNYRFIRNKKEEPYQQIAMKKGVAELTFTVTDTDLKKKLYLDFDFIHDNDFATDILEFDIRESVDRNLEITTQVFRDKIQPGVPEKWILTIKGKDKDKINAEVLASMYDASLDQFVKNQFNFTHYIPNNYDRYYGYDYYNHSINDFFRQLVSSGSLDLKSGQNRYPINSDNPFPVPKAPHFEYTTIKSLRRSSGDSYSYYTSSKDSAKMKDIQEVVVMGFSSKTIKNTSLVYIVDGKLVKRNIPDDEIAEVKKLDPSEAASLYGERASGGAFLVTSKKAMKEELLKKVKARTNLDETAFFLPNLYTDSEGNIKLEFTSPEALTQWKLILFAHTKDLKTGSAEFLTQTQKELMVTPNPPRFLRQGDQIQLSAKIDNLSDKDLAGDIMLYLFDPETSKPLDSAFVNTHSLKKMTVSAKGSAEASWEIKIPYAVDHVAYKILAKTKNYSDGEENILPVLSDRMLVTETIPISIKEGQSKTYTMNGLLNNTSSSAANFNLSVELTSNPLWFAVMSIPYLRTFPHECSEQLFSRLYGNMLSTYIMNSSPKIKTVFDEWNAKETPANPLETNEKLKSVLIGETPWLSSIKDQKEQMQQLALFFNLNRMQKDLKKAQRDLVDRQNSDGSFSWFPGGNKDKIISGHILAGFGKLNTMLKGQSGDYFTGEINRVIKRSIDYLDKEYDDQLIEGRKRGAKLDLSDYSSYFYYRSYWIGQKEIPSKLKKVLHTLSQTYAKDFDQYSLYHQAMIATFLQRYGYKDLAKKCVASLKKSAKTSEEYGMYWENNSSGWYWYQAPVETQAMLIEAFAETTPEDVGSVEEMKVWLLKNKQSESWGTTKSTTEAVYALLNYGKSWMDSERGITMTLGNETVLPEKNSSETSGAGFFKKSYYWKDITPEKGKLEIKKTSPGVAWGGMYRLYYENMDQITTHNSSNVSVEKKLFLKTFEGNESKLQEITAELPVRLGDLVVVRLVVRTDRDMEYIHLKDMRASGFEPVNVLSSYKWQNGAGYYESTKDAATHFFFSYLSKGTYVFEYELKANNVGEFSNGMTSFQNMYAPAMSAHTEGTRVRIIK